MREKGKFKIFFLSFRVKWNISLNIVFVFIEKCKRCQRELGTLKGYENYDFRFRHVDVGWGQYTISLSEIH